MWLELFRHFGFQGGFPNLTVSFSPEKETVNSHYGPGSNIFYPYAGFVTLFYFMTVALVSHLAPMADPRRLVATLLGLCLQMVPSLLWVSGFNPKAVVDFWISCIPGYVRHYTFTQRHHQHYGHPQH